VYDEIMRVPLYVRAPGVTTPGTTTDALATHVDLARTIGSLAGADDPSLVGRDLVPVLRDPLAPGRETVLLAQDMAWYESCIPLRYAMRAIFDGRHKYARYYGVGGGFDRVGRPSKGPKQVDVHADFEDHDHELVRILLEVVELVNLANDRGRRREVREWFNRLRDEEARELVSR
jgi:arylsulfatase A-like enzyme